MKSPSAAPSRRPTRGVPPAGAKELSAAAVRKLGRRLQLQQVALKSQNRELRRTQRELQAARDRFAGFYDFAPIAHLTLNQMGDILEANLKASELLGMERSRLLREKFTRFVPPQMQAACDRLCQRIFSSSERQGVELTLVNAQAQPVFVQVEAVRDLTSQRKQCRFSFTDISGRIRVEAALRESSQFNQQIIAGAKEGIIVNDLELKHRVAGGGLPRPFARRVLCGSVPSASVIATAGGR